MKLIVTASVLFGILVGIFIHSAVVDYRYLAEKSKRAELLSQTKRLKRQVEYYEYLLSRCGCMDMMFNLRERNLFMAGK